MADAKLNVAISATDGTQKGVASAGKRFSKLAKDASGVGKDTSGLQRFSQGVAAMERATARSLGGRSVSAAAGERFSAVSHAAQTFSEAREAGGGGLGGMLGLATSGLGLFAGGLIAAGAAAFSFVDGWAKDAAALGRLSAATGMAAKDLDALAAAGERVGVTRDQSNASVATLGKLLNDAQYGRSNDTKALENQLGIGLKTDANGTPDTKAFLLDLSDRISSQKNPYTQQEIADRFGVSALLPLLRRGRGAVAAELADAEQNAPTHDQEDTDRGQRIFSKKNQIEQRAKRVVNAAGAEGAVGEEAGADAILRVANDPRARDVASQAGHAISAGAGAVGHALNEGAHVVERGFGRVGKSLEDVIHTIAAVARETGTDARQMLTTARIESHFDPNAHAKGSSAAGLYQFLDRSGASLGVAGDARYDPRQAALAYVREMQRDQPKLEHRLGRQANPWELYLLHQQGLGGAIKALTGDQNRRAVDVLGRKEVTGNGGTAAMTLADFHGLWQHRYDVADRANEHQGIYRIAQGQPAPAAPQRAGLRAPIIVPLREQIPSPGVSTRRELAPARTPAVERASLILAQPTPGSPGAPGLPGSPGLAGKGGEAGSPGAPGAAGLPGVAARAGFPGEPGAAGRGGEAGSPGAPGLPGPPGLAGRGGLAGEAGRPGEAGSPGAPGLPGEAGAPGIPGLTPLAGAPGQQGLPGLPGASAPAESPVQAVSPATAKAEVVIRLAGAPQGTITRVSAGPGVDVKVERALLGQ